MRIPNTSLPRRLTVAAGVILAAAATLGTANAPTADAASLAKGTVHAQGGLISHDRPSTHAPQTFRFRNGATLGILCQTKGTSVGGSRTWYLFATEGTDGQWVAGKYVTVSGHPQTCGGTAIAATAKTSTGVYVGPARKDHKVRTLSAGSHAMVLCYTGNTGRPQWVLTTHNHWLRKSAVHTAKKVPYCSN